jgi:hypothetical protein
MDPMQNKWNLGPSADPVPTSDAGSAMACNQNYGTELRFEVALISGHSYRFQVIAHDGDQNKGGDSGEACAIFCAGSGMSSCPGGATECPGGNSSACPPGHVCSTTGCCVQAPQ